MKQLHHLQSTDKLEPIVGTLGLSPKYSDKEPKYKQMRKKESKEIDIKKNMEAPVVIANIDSIKVFKKKSQRSRS